MKFLKQKIPLIEELAFNHQFPSWTENSKLSNFLGGIFSATILDYSWTIVKIIKICKSNLKSSWKFQSSCTSMKNVSMRVKFYILYGILTGSDRRRWTVKTKLEMIFEEIERERVKLFPFIPTVRLLFILLSIQYSRTYETYQDGLSFHSWCFSVYFPPHCNLLNIFTKGLQLSSFHFLCRKIYIIFTLQLKGEYWNIPEIWCIFCIS